MSAQKFSKKECGIRGEVCESCGDEYSDRWQYRNCCERVFGMKLKTQKTVEKRVDDFAADKKWTKPALEKFFSDELKFWGDKAKEKPKDQRLADLEDRAKHACEYFAEKYLV